MPSPSMLGHLVLDGLARLVGQTQPRVPEPTLVMDDPVQVEAFELAGREDGLLAPTYLYHAIQASAAIRPGDRVLDLGCGPACQLAVIARLNPAASFVGVDASGSMLDLARQTQARCALDNIEFRQGSMENLVGIADASMDAVLSTMSLHHLADESALAAVFREIRRVLKPGGGVYLADFGRLNRAATQHFFAYQRAGIQPPVFTLDYHHSLRAAFSLDSLLQAARLLGDVVVESTFLVPFLVAVRSRQRRELDVQQQVLAAAAYTALDPRQRYDLRDLSRFFAHGGFSLAFRPW